MKAVLFISHGSRFPKLEEEVRCFVEDLRRQSDISIFEYAFLDIMSPSIPEGISACVEQGATEIIILLNFLNTGQHVDEDIPRIVSEVREKYPEVTFRLTKPIGQHSQIVDLFLDMIEKNDQL